MNGTIVAKKNSKASEAIKHKLYGKGNLLDQAYVLMFIFFGGL